MIETKDNFSGGLDLDSSPYRLPHNSYIDGLNITRDAVTSNQDQIISNIVGNRLVNYNYHAGGTPVTIGSYGFPLRNTVIEFAYHPTGYHSIIEYDNTARVRNKIFENLTDSGSIDVLGFTQFDKITSVFVYPRGNGEGDLLCFIDSLGRPSILNIQSFKAGTYTPVTRDILDFNKNAPTSVPLCGYDNDTSKRVNNLRNKHFRLKQRWVYADLQKSVCSPISAVPLPFNALDDTYTSVVTNNNVIRCVFQSGGKEVKKIEILMSYVDRTNNWSDFALVESVDKTNLLLKSVTSFSISGTATTVTTIFTGGFAVGTVINIYLTLLPATQTLIATYTTVLGDNLSTVTAGLVTSMLAIGIGTIPVSFGGSIFYNFDNSAYAFNRVDITGAGSADNIDFSYAFYNDSTYPPIPINESIQLYWYVPDKANAMEFPDGNVPIFGGITEGYDKQITPNVVNVVSTVAAGGGSEGNISSLLNYNVQVVGIQRMQYRFSGIPATGTLIQLRYRRFSDGVIIVGSTYTTLAGDTAQTVATKLAAVNTAPSVTTTDLGGATVRADINRTTYEPFAGTGNYSDVVITPPATSLAPNSIPTWKWSSQRDIAIAYFDQKGKTNGILYNARISFPAYSDNVGGQIFLPTLNTKIYHVPPDWAYSYQFYFNKDATQYLFFSSVDVNISEANFVYFDLTSLSVNAKKNPTTATVLSYSFQEGDRMRLIKAIGLTTFFADTYDAAVVGLVVEPTISGAVQTGKTFLKIKKTAPFVDATFTPNNHTYLIEIYRPVQQTSNGANSTTEVFFEFGQNYPILNPTTNTRAHGGMVTNQSTDYVIPAEFNFAQGDSYFRSRSIAITDSGSATFYVQDRNFVDFYISAINSISGRPNIIDVNAKKSYYSTMVRFGEAYQADTNINGINQFYANNFDQYDLSGGDILRITRRAKYLRIFQKFKIGKVPLYGQIERQPNGSKNLIVTDKLINPIEYYEGNFGLGEAKESIASLNYADYFADTNKGVLCRVSEDGIIVISLLYKLNSFSNDKVPLRIGNYKIYGAVEQKSNNYIAALEATGSDPAATLVFDESSNSFETFLSLLPESMCSLGNLLIAFKNGQLWTHDNTVYNNFFGVQYDSYITLVFNDIPSANKAFMAISETANTVWEAPAISTNIESYLGTLQSSNLVAADFTKQEGKFNSPILRDINSIGGINNGDEMRGTHLVVKLRVVAAASLVTLNIVSLHYISSPVINS